MDINGQDLIRACSAIGAGLAGNRQVSDPGVGHVSQQDTEQRQ